MPSPPAAGQAVDVCRVEVRLGIRGERSDYIASLMLNQTRDELRDALIRCAEEHGGRLAAWNDDDGTFLFVVASSTSYEDCCRCAQKMLEHFQAIRKGSDRASKAEAGIAIWIGCDVGRTAYGPDSPLPPSRYASVFSGEPRNAGLESRVVVTEDFLGRLDPALGAHYARWAHAPELGFDLYAWESGPSKSPLVLPGLRPEPAPAAVPPPAAADALEVAVPRGGPARPLPAWARSRLATAAATAVLSVAAVEAVRWALRPGPPPAPAAAGNDPPAPLVWGEQVQGEEWKAWRRQFHERISAGPVTERSLAEALRIKQPPRPGDPAGVMRHDQAVADVLMSYPAVGDLLYERFGIDRRTFLGSGLSKPSRSDQYGAAGIHEYLIGNHQDRHVSVWWRSFDLDKNSGELNRTIRDLLQPSPQSADPKASLAKDIVERVENPAQRFPAAIRFGRLFSNDYSQRLGRPERRRVFASNLSEVWNLTVAEAAQQSGHRFDRGDTVYLWVFLPHNAEEIVPATWGEVVRRLPEWLSENPN